MRHEELIEAYLRDLDRALGRLERTEREDVVCGVREHIGAFLADSPVTEERVRQVLDDLGPVERIALEAREGQGTAAAADPDADAGPDPGTGPGPEAEPGPGSPDPGADGRGDPPDTTRVDPCGTDPYRRPVPGGPPHGHLPPAPPDPFPTGWADGFRRPWAVPVGAVLVIACLIGLVTHPLAVIVTGGLVTIAVLFVTGGRSSSLLLVAGAGLVVCAVAWLFFAASFSDSGAGPSPWTPPAGGIEHEEPSLSPPSTLQPGAVGPSTAGTAGPAATGRSPDASVTPPVPATSSTGP